MISDSVAEFAENPTVYLPPEPGEERIVDTEFCLTVSPGNHFWSCGLQRIRFEPGRVEEALMRVRAELTKRGRHESVWSIGPSATPSTVLSDLLSLGLVKESETGSEILVCTSEPSPAAGDDSTVEVREVVTLEDHTASVNVGITAFAMPDADAHDERDRVAMTFDAERQSGATARFLALSDGEPVGTGRAWMSDRGLYLGGGATIPEARGRGAMTAIVRAAWDLAMQRGTPALVTFGGSESAPILVRRGFRSIGRMDHLIDLTDRP